MLKPIREVSRNYFPDLQATHAIELIEYGDFQCEHCAHVFPVVKCLQKVMGSQLKFSFRHFPLANLHPLALETAIAAEAAALQGKFWSMHDLIFNNQRFLTRASLLDFAETLGLDVRLFKTSREHKGIFNKVIHDFDTGVNKGVRDTPTFFINGFRYWGKNDLDSLYSACQHHLMLKDRQFTALTGSSE